MKHQKILPVLALAVLMTMCSIPAFSAPLGTAFTFQGQLVQSGTAAEGDYDFKFNLLDGPDPLTAAELTTTTLLDVTVSGGLFTVEIDFGAVFLGEAYWLETEVRPAGIGGLTTLFPPHQLTATPYALNAERFGGLDTSEVVTTESDPTVNANVKDGITWLEIANRPFGLDDGDDVGLTSVSWAQVGSRPAGLDNGDDFEAQTAIHILPSGKVGIGVPNPQNQLHVDGILRLNGFANASSTHVCKLASGPIATCSSSGRYKTEVENLSSGMELIEKLRPVTFRWKDRSERGVGFIAEEVAEISPLFVTRERGQVEGVRYGELTTLLVNAIKEQQADIKELRTLLGLERPEEAKSCH